MSPRAFDPDRLEREVNEADEGPTHLELEVFSPVYLDGQGNLPLPLGAARERRREWAGLSARVGFALAPEFADLRLEHRCGNPDGPHGITCGVRVSPQVLDPNRGLDDYVSLRLTYPPGQSRRWWARVLEVVGEMRHADSHPDDYAARFPQPLRQWERDDLDRWEADERRRRLEQQELAQPPPTPLAPVGDCEPSLHRHAS